MKKKVKGKAPAQGNGCGGNKCGACKDCYDELKQCLYETKMVLTKVRGDYKAVLANEMSLKENVIALKEQILNLTSKRDQLNLTLEFNSAKEKNNGLGRWSKRHLSGVDLPTQEIVSTIVKEAFSKHENASTGRGACQ